MDKTAAKQSKVRGILLTPERAHASGQDAGCANMRKHGRKIWNDEDWNVAVAVQARLLSYLPHPYPEIAKRMLEG